MRNLAWLPVVVFALLRTNTFASLAPVRELTTSAETCDDGLTCPTRNSSAPGSALDDCQACEGYYLAPSGEALRCDLFLDDGGSTCLGHNKCADGHRGFMCGACDIGYGRNGGRFPCKPCSRFGTSLPTLAIACTLIFHTFVHAFWGTVLGVLAVGAAFSVKRLHLLLLRIFMQWVSVSTALFAFDINDMDSDASGVDPIPEWLRPLTGFVKEWGGSFIHGVPSPPLLLDCFVYFLAGGATEEHDAHLRRFKAILPVAWWLALPVFTLLWQVILCIFVAKVIYPLSLSSKLRLASPGVSWAMDSRRSDPAANSMYTVFGLFRDTRLASVLADSLPILLVGLYSVWGIVTKGLLTSMQSKTYLQESRWLVDPGVRWGEAEHTAVAVLAIFGVVLFSFGMNVALFMVLYRRKTKLRQFNTLRTYGFFFNGFEPDWYHWELVHKRMDVLAVYVVTYSNIIPKVQGRLLLCMTFAGFAWALHCEALPFDDRHNELLDQCERFGLRSRFMSVLMLQMLVLFKAQGFDLMVNVCAASLVVGNAWYLIIMGMLIIYEFSMNSTARQSGGRGNRCLALFRRFSYALAKEKAAVAEVAPSFEWLGIGNGVNIGKKRQLKIFEHFSSPRGCFRYLIRSLYGLGHTAQLVYASKLFGKIMDHLITNAKVTRMPGAFVDFVFLLAMCLRSHPLEVDVDTMLRDIAEKCEAYSSASDDVVLDGRMVCAEDLSRALLYLHRLDIDEIRKLLDGSMFFFHEMNRDTLMLEIETIQSKSYVLDNLSNLNSPSSRLVAVGSPTKTVTFDFEEGQRSDEERRRPSKRSASAMLQTDLEERLEVATKRAEAAESQLNRLASAMRQMGLEAQLAELAEGGDEMAKSASGEISDVSTGDMEEIAAELFAHGIERASRRRPSRSSEPEDERHSGRSSPAWFPAEAAQETSEKAPVVSKETVEGRSAAMVAHCTARTNRTLLSIPSAPSGEASAAHRTARTNQKLLSIPSAPSGEVSEPPAQTDTSRGSQESLVSPRTAEAWRRHHQEVAKAHGSYAV
eukprot:CAMPEP_0117466754 /NCGR_PEP_ID=MMETSP0784-20121206/5305_1 /TAXON_ID=39447 /ORGANISM="" /LENGTH=1034 /DNA_ID=CAMNT_0005260705 /DNA_START=54 /DNA_END=3158 /DNA_ORIENTATION=+